MVLKDKRNHCFLVCNLRPVFEKVKFDVRRSLEPFKDLDGRSNPSLTALTKRYMCFLHVKCGCLRPIMAEKRPIVALHSAQLCCKSTFLSKRKLT